MKRQIAALAVVVLVALAISPSRAETIREFLTRQGLTQESADAAEQRCFQAVRVLFKKPEELKLGVFLWDGMIRRTPDRAYQQYGWANLPWRSFGWRCILQPSLTDVRSAVVYPQCRNRGMTFEEGALDLKRPPAYCIDDHRDLRIRTDHPDERVRNIYESRDREHPTADRKAPTSGIAASWAQIRTVFESRFGLQFSPVPLRDGRPRLLAEDKRELRTVEIIGSEERVSSVSVIVFSTTISAALIRPGSLLATLLEVAAPQWKSGSRWVVGYLTKADDYIEGTTQHDKLQVNIKVARPLGMITLTVESR